MANSRKKTKKPNRQPSRAAKPRAGRDFPGDLSSEKMLARLIRVDHAGEYGAKRIYEGQLAVAKRKAAFEESRLAKGRSPFKKSISRWRETAELISEMKDHEQVHLDFFSAEIPKRRVRPTALLPLWHVGGFALGAATALLGEKAAMACTVAVEEAIEDHYNAQIASLGDDPSHTELKKTLRQFCDDELHHRDIGLDHGAEDAPGYQALYAVISRITKSAIWLSERV